MLSIMTAMAGSSRTLYQGSYDGWLPRYLSHVNEHGAPTRAMWTDLVVNLIVLAIACADATSFFFILAVSNVGYIIFNFLNLNAGWIHRIDNGHVHRPWKAPTCLRVVFASSTPLPLPRRRCQGVEPDGAVGRPLRFGPHRAGVHLPSLHPGPRQVPRPHAGRSRPDAGGPRQEARRRPSLPGARCRCGGDARCQLVLPVAGLTHKAGAAPRCSGHFISVACACHRKETKHC
ncbi:MAG: APC family permease [Hyphomicrobium sp.]